MNIWLPYPNMRLSVHVLDVSTLARQRRDAVHLLKILAGRSGGRYRFERAVDLWRGSEGALCYYAQACFDEMEARGYGTAHFGPRTADGARDWRYPVEWVTAEPLPPDWVGVERLHASHRAALLRRDGEWYAQFCWAEAPVTDLFWPGSLPIVGGRLWSDTWGEAVVLEQVGADFRCLLDGDEVIVTRDEVRRCQWRRAWN